MTVRWQSVRICVGLGATLPRVYDQWRPLAARHILEQLDSIYLIDDKITAPSFGFGTADNYYATQSAQNFLADISRTGIFRITRTCG